MANSMIFWTAYTASDREQNEERATVSDTDGEHRCAVFSTQDGSSWSVCVDDELTDDGLPSAEAAKRSAIDFVLS